LIKTENLTVLKKINPGVNPKPILKNISFQLKKRQITCLIGESGAGKTIFAKTISALLPPGIEMVDGTLYFESEPVDYENLKKLRGSHIFYTPQNAAASLNPVIKIKNQISETSNISHKKLLVIFEALGIHDRKRVLNSYPFQLSEGENQRCLLAMAIAAQPQFLILDEPTTGFDTSLQKEFIKIIKKIHHQYNLTILLITHNLFLARTIANFVYILLQGEIVEQGEFMELFSSPKHKYTKEIVKYLFNS